LEDIQIFMETVESDDEYSASDQLEREIRRLLRHQEKRKKRSSARKC
jgi:ribosome-associated translation inhibitor RaiA